MDKFKTTMDAMKGRKSVPNDKKSKLLEIIHKLTFNRKYHENMETPADKDGE